MPFKLSEIVSPETARSKNADEAAAPRRSDAVSGRLSAKCPNTGAQPKARSGKDLPGDALLLPAQISRFVIFRSPSGSLQLVQKSTEQAAKEFKEKLEDGYVGN